MDGAEWAELLRVALSGGAEVERFIDFVERGESARPTASSAPLSPEELELLRRRHRLWQQTVDEVTQPLKTNFEAYLSIERELPQEISMAIFRLFPRAPVAGKWPLSRALSPVGTMTLSAAERALAGYGHSATDIVEAVFGQRHAAGRVSWFSDFSDWVETHAELIRPHLLAGAKHPATAWSVVVDGGPAAVRAFCADAVVAATGSSKKVRNLAAQGVRSLPFGLVEGHLRAALVDGSADQRRHAAELLIETTPADKQPEVRDWLRELASTDRSSAVRKTVERITSTEESETEPVETTIDMEEETSAEVRADIPPWLQGFLEHPDRPTLGRIAPSIVAEIELIGRLPPVVMARLAVTPVAQHREHIQLLADMLRAVEPTPTPADLDAVPTDGRVKDAHRTVRAVTWLVLADPGPWAPDVLEAWVSSNEGLLIRHARSKPDRFTSKEGLFKLIGCIPSRTTSSNAALFDIAIAGAKVDRPHARAVLGTDALELVADRLASTRRDERSEAAKWLASDAFAHAATDATQQALLSAYESEKVTAVKETMLVALQSLELETTDSAAGPADWEREAAVAMRKAHPVPKKLSWLDTISLSNLSWSTGQPISTELLLWVAATAIRNERIEPSPSHVKLTAAILDEDRGALGDELLRQWIARDLRTLSLEDAEALAEHKVINHGSILNRFPVPKSVHLERALSTPIGSAMDCKGLLGIVAACNSAEAANTVGQYLALHGHSRKGPSAALVEMLGSMNHMSTDDLAIDIAQGTWFPTVRQTAAHAVERIAKRRQWNADFVSDLLAEKGEFNKNGELFVGDSPKGFVARIEHDRNVSLMNRNTNEIACSVPALDMFAAGHEDARFDHRQQQRLTRSKRAVANSFATESERLGHATRAGRTWTLEEFTRGVLGHPVIRTLAAERRWTATNDNGTIMFGLDHQGTATDSDGETVEFDDQITIALGLPEHI